MATIQNSTTTPTAAKKQTSRGSSFTPVEDESIARAWAAASEDAIVGTEQKGNEFFQKIQTLYNEEFKPANRESRSVVSIKTRCKAIHKECIVFSVCHARVTRLHPTGVSPTDIINVATGLYNGVEVGNVEDDCGKPFKHLQAWNVLRRHQKFLVAGEKHTTLSLEKGTSGGSEQSEDPADLPKDQQSVSESLSGQRPMGRKRAKEQKFKEEATKTKLRLAAESVAAQKERNEALKRQYEIMPFINFTCGLRQQGSARVL